MGVYRVLNRIELLPVEATRSLQSHGIQPKLGYHILAPDVNMWRFPAVQRDEEETIRTISQDRRHVQRA